MPSHLGEHSKLATFEKRNAKTLKDEQRHGDILMLYDTIYTYT